MSLFMYKICISAIFMARLYHIHAVSGHHYLGKGRTRGMVPMTPPILFYFIFLKKNLLFFMYTYPFSFSPLYIVASMSPPLDLVMDKVKGSNKKLFQGTPPIYFEIRWPGLGIKYLKLRFSCDGFTHDHPLNYSVLKCCIIDVTGNSDSILGEMIQCM